MTGVQTCALPISLALLDNRFDSVKRTAADKENVLGVYLNKLLVRMLSAALRGNVSGSTLKDF